MWRSSACRLLTDVTVNTLGLVRSLDSQWGLLDGDGSNKALLFAFFPLGATRENAPEVRASAITPIFLEARKTHPSA